MPGKGNHIVKVRMSPEMEAEVRECIASANLSRREAEYDISEWVRTAIREKLAHIRRSRSRTKKQAVIAASTSPVAFTPGEAV